MSNEKGQFKIKHNNFVDFIFNEKFRVYRIILGIVLVLVSLIFVETFVKVILWLIGLMFIASGVVKSCPIRERVKKQIKF